MSLRLIESFRKYVIKINMIQWHRENFNNLSQSRPPENELTLHWKNWRKQIILTVNKLRFTVSSFLLCICVLYPLLISRLKSFFLCTCLNIVLQLQFYTIFTLRKSYVKMVIVILQNNRKINISSTD